MGLKGGPGLTTELALLGGYFRREGPLHYYLPTHIPELFAFHPGIAVLSKITYYLFNYDCFIRSHPVILVFCR